jgi:hypothetical protein
MALLFRGWMDIPYFTFSLGSIIGPMGEFSVSYARAKFMD